MCIIESMPVKSLITFPKSGIGIAAGKPFEVRGHAWAGDLAVAALEVSVDFGTTWQPGIVEPSANRLAWQRWRANGTLPIPDYTRFGPAPPTLPDTLSPCPCLDGTPKGI
jgi:sulfite oxidase